MSRSTELRREHRPLENHAVLRLGPNGLDRSVEKRLVGHEPGRLDAAGRGNDHLRLRVIDARRELHRCEPAEDDRVDRAYSRAGEHRDQGLRDHGHVDHDAVAALDPETDERSGERRDCVSQLAIGQRRSSPETGES